ncbi:MAG: nucleotidyltransferase [Armatimonadetes bacterium]|nr:nucleotidyltransferase [Armatimonadota bacterium]MDI9583865.1 nucleotidyltransferase [Acidobacteriota bacterium]
MAIEELPPDFREFLQLLASRSVEYLLVGGYAVAYHGYVRATADMDIWVAASEGNAAKLVAVLGEFGFDVPGLTPDLFTEPGNIVRLGEPPIRIEILTKVSGVTFEDCYARRIVDTVDGVAVNLISLEHLRANKAASGRLKDLADLEHLS